MVPRHEHGAGDQRWPPAATAINLAHNPVRRTPPARTSARHSIRSSASCGTSRPPPRDPPSGRVMRSIRKVVSLSSPRETQEVRPVRHVAVGPATHTIGVRPGERLPHAPPAARVPPTDHLGGRTAKAVIGRNARGAWAFYSVAQSTTAHGALRYRRDFRSSAKADPSVRLRKA
jgi:hypothetical protein